MVLNATVQSQSKYNFNLHEMPVPLAYAEHRIILECNAEFARLFGYGRAELRNKSFHLLYPNFEDFVRTGQMWSTNMTMGITYYDERIMIKADQTRFWCKVRGRSMTSANPFAKAVYCFEPLPRAIAASGYELTDRQRQIVALVAQGKTNGVIAEELDLSKRTVEAHRARIMKAIGVKNTAELIAWFSAHHSAR